MKAVLISTAVGIVVAVGLAVALIGGDAPEERIGEQVTLTGEVASFYPGAFTLGDSTFGDELLVVPGRGTALPPVIRRRAGTPQVEVTGTVLRKGEGVELVPGEQFEPFDGQPYVRADRVTVLEEESAS